MTSKVLVKHFTSNNYWIIPSTETRDPWKKRKRAKHAKAYELLFLFVCGFFLILVDLQGVIVAVGSILVSAVQF